MFTSPEMRKYIRCAIQTTSTVACYLSSENARRLA
jgi:hypothetical protein